MIKIYGDCSKCKQLCDMLKNIDHEHITDENIVNQKADELGLMYAPIVIINDELVEFMPHPIMYFRHIKSLMK